MKKQYIIGAVALAAIVGGYFAYKQFYKKNINKTTGKDIDATKGKPIEDKDLPKEFWNEFNSRYKIGGQPANNDVIEIESGKKYIYTITDISFEPYYIKGYWSLV